MKSPQYRQVWAAALHLFSKGIHLVSCCVKGQYSEERGSKQTEMPLSFVLKIRSAALLDSTVQHNTDQQRGNNFNQQNCNNFKIKWCKLKAPLYIFFKSTKLRYFRDEYPPINTYMKYITKHDNILFCIVCNKDKGQASVLACRRH